MAGAAVTKKLGAAGVWSALGIPGAAPQNVPSGPSNNQVLARLVVACHVMTRTSCFAGSGTRGRSRRGIFVFHDILGCAFNVVSWS